MPTSAFLGFQSAATGDTAPVGLEGSCSTQELPSTTQDPCSAGYYQGKGITIEG